MLARSNRTSDVRVQTVAARLFSYYIDILQNIAAIMSLKACGKDEEASRLVEAFEADFGKRECEIERYFNQCFFFGYLRYVVIRNASKLDFVL